MRVDLSRRIPALEVSGSHRCRVAGRVVAVRCDGPRATLCLRPEALVIEEAERARGGIPGTVAGYAFEGGRQLYDVAIPGATLRIETIGSTAQGRGFKHGDRVRVEVSSESAMLLPDEAEPTG